MFEIFKKAISKHSKDAVRAYQEGRYDMDEETRKAFDRFGLPYDSDLGSIKRRYRALSKIYHPDTGESSNTADFLTIKKSYDRLSSVVAHRS